MTQVVIHPRVTGGSRLRIWAGVFDAPGNDDLSLQWSLDGEITQPATLTELRLAIDNGAGYEAVSSNSTASHQIRRTASS